MRLHNDDSYALGTNIIRCAFPRHVHKERDIQLQSCQLPSPAFVPTPAESHTRTALLASFLDLAWSSQAQLEATVADHGAHGHNLAMLACSSETPSLRCANPSRPQSASVYPPRSHIFAKHSIWDLSSADVPVRYPLLPEHDSRLSSCGAELPCHFHAVVRSDLTSATSRVWIAQDPGPAAQLPNGTYQHQLARLLPSRHGVYHIRAHHRRFRPKCSCKA